MGDDLTSAAYIIFQSGDYYKEKSAVQHDFSFSDRRAREKRHSAFDARYDDIPPRIEGRAIRGIVFGLPLAIALWLIILVVIWAMVRN